MKKENRNKAAEEVKNVAPVAETEKEEKEIQVNQDKVGSLMHEARLKKGLKIADASRDLCIRASYLEAIEAGNYEEIPEPPYGIGFIRSYADYLGLNSARMVQLFKEETDAASKNSDYYVMEPQTEVTAPNKKYLLISLAAVFAVYLGWFMFNESQNKAAEDVSETSGYMAETSETVVDFPLQVEDFASVEENVADSPSVDEQLPVVDVAPVSDGTGDNITVSISSYGVLRFITIVEGFLHAYNGLHAFINVFRIEPTDPDQIIADLLFLEMQLLGVGECLQLAAATLSVVCTFRFHTKRRRL